MATNNPFVSESLPTVQKQNVFLSFFFTRDTVFAVFTVQACRPLLARSLACLNLSMDDSEYSDERSSPGGTRQKPFRKRVYAFLEARTPWGRRFEAFIMLVIFVTVTQVRTRNALL